jgi:chemotaxis response regulator CheB
MSFPIVGIGASAGGLESFSELVAGIPAHTGMAYLFVQHLNPRRASLLVNILSKRATFWNAKHSHPNEARGFCSSSEENCAGVNTHQS